MIKHYLTILFVILVSTAAVILLSSVKKQLPVSTATVNKMKKPEKPAVIPLKIGAIPPPMGYTLASIPPAGFAHWLLQLPLRKNNTIYLYDGSRKQNQTLHYAVLDLPYNRNVLQQCADAVMRLRAEYIYQTKEETGIRFLHRRNEYFSCVANCTRPQLEVFLNHVFSWCGTYSLQAQLRPVINMKEIQPGDVFVRGGSPGHAMLVAAVAQNSKGEKVFLLLQSFIPAQDIHIVVNPYNSLLSPWYAASEKYIATPGYTFTATDLRRW